MVECLPVKERVTGSSPVETAKQMNGNFGRADTKEFATENVNN